VPGAAGRQAPVRPVTRLRAPATYAPMPESTFVLTGAYYDVRGPWQSTLTLNNKGADETRPVVTLFSPMGEAYTVPDVVIGGNDFRDLDLATVVRQAGPSFQQGSLRVAYVGKRLEMGAAVVIADLDAGVSFDEQFTYAPPSGSTRREGVWWRPTAATRLSLVVTNRSEEAITVRAALDGAQPTSGARPAGRRTEVALGPHELRVVEFGAALDAVGRLGGLTLEVDGPPGALVARGFVADPAIGYSASVAFGDPTTGRTSTYHGAGARLHTTGGATTAPVFVARNVGAGATTVQGRVVLALGGGQTEVRLLPDTPLAPGQAAILPAEAIWREAAARPDVVAAGLEFTYTSAPGNVIISAAATSPDGNEVYQVPLLDPETPPSSTGGYPWRVAADGSASTVVYLKNTTDAPQTYLLQVSFAGGAWAPGLKTLAAGETLALDLRQVRDAQVPDNLGRTIPFGVVSGQVHWSAKSRERHAMIGRAETVDAAHGVSSTYACVNCCPDNPYESWFEPEELSLSVGESAGLVAWLRDKDCYDTILEAYDLGEGQLQWSSTNSGVATTTWSTVSATGDGTAHIHADYSTDWWAEDQNYDCEYDPYVVSYVEQVHVQCAIPVNYRQTGVTDLGQGVLKFSYTWDSSTGNKADLSSCRVGERVDYYAVDMPPAKPPFPAGFSPNDPTTADAAGDLPGGEDTHSTSSPFQTPYSEAQVRADQIYRYHCPCMDGDNWQTLMGPILINRQVTQNGSGGWKFFLSKSGVTSTYDPLPSLDWFLGLASRPATQPEAVRASEGRR
jgi:hypothetical protein